jgi:hypothetical protein
LQALNIYEEDIKNKNSKILLLEKELQAITNSLENSNNTLKMLEIRNTDLNLTIKS